MQQWPGTVQIKKGELKYPNLGVRFNQLVAGFEEEWSTAKQSAEVASLYSDESIAVTIHLSGHVNEVVIFVEDSGGDPRNVGKDYFEAYVPVPLLRPVSERPGVIKATEITPPHGGKVLT